MGDLKTTNPKWMLELGPDKLIYHTEDEIFEIIRRVPWALKFIQDPKFEWIDFALKNHYQAISFVEQTVEMQRLAISYHYSAVSFIEDLDETLAMELITNQPAIIYQIKNPTDVMKNVAKLLT